MTDKRFVEFVEREQAPLRKTRIWAVISIMSGDTLGHVSWENTWRQYVFGPYGDTMWSAGCLEDVGAFMATANREHRVGVARRAIGIKGGR